ncbi:MAG: hypothetical protein WA905_10220, partial [Pseudolabrys sp.]
MAGLVPAIHVFKDSQGVDARHKACARAGLRPDPGAGHDEREANHALSVMAGLVPAIHVFKDSQDMDSRHKAGHDEQEA